MSSRRRDAGGARGDGGAPSRQAELQRHLESEDPDTDSSEMARLWMRAYNDLVEFEEKILARLQELLPSLSPEARHEAELTNVPMVAQHLQTFRYRRAHWRQRLQELNGQ